MKKKNMARKDDLFETGRFCTECGEELENFSLDKEASDGETVERRFHNCKETGKFKGEICSRKFINNLKEDDLPEEDTNYPDNEVY
jgi:hypothetical protein